MTERKAFDIGKYPKTALGQDLMAQDVASLFIECAPDPNKRITPYIYIQTNDGQVICPEFGNKDIKDILSFETPEDIVSSNITLQLRENILRLDCPEIMVWISPPSKKFNYERASVVISLCKKEKGLNIVKNYGIATKLTEEELIFCANLLFSQSEDPQYFANNDEEVRNKLICVSSSDQDPIDFLQENIVLPQEVWENIKNQVPEKEKEKKLIDAKKAVEQHGEIILFAKTESQQISVGARIERTMVDYGNDIRSDSGCGELNMSLEQNSVSTSSTSGTENGVFCKKCPYCQREINAFISSGFICQCGQVYKGGCGENSLINNQTEEEDETNEIISTFAGIFSLFFFAIGAVASSN